ncbi:class I SAM-dependent methyltransferase [Bradyrhizobium guangxiense]
MWQIMSGRLVELRHLSFHSVGTDPLVGRFLRVNKERFPDEIKLGDIVEGLPVPAETVVGAYASHVLEHLSYEAFWVALRNTYSMLAPGGIFRLVVPDLETRARYYCSELARGATDANSQFLRLAHLGQEKRPNGIFGKFRSSFGNSAHLWMWDFPSMSTALTTIGFTNIRRAHFNDCEDPMFKLVEDKKRFYWSPKERSNEQYEECAVQAQKPR